VPGRSTESLDGMATVIAAFVLTASAALLLLAGHSLLIRIRGGRPQVLANMRYPWWVDIGFVVLFVIPFISAIEALFMDEPFWIFHVIARLTGNAV
jgi:hypothetical protein